jgi:hypothetical protein
VYKRELEESLNHQNQASLETFKHSPLIMKFALPLAFLAFVAILVSATAIEAREPGMFMHYRQR